MRMVSTLSSISNRLGRERISKLFDERLAQLPRGTTRYWQDPAGKLIQVEDHGVWAGQQEGKVPKTFSITRRPAGDKEFAEWNSYYLNWSGCSDAYKLLFNKGWQRVTKVGRDLEVDETGPKISRTQYAALEMMAIEKELFLYRGHDLLYSPREIQGQALAKYWLSPSVELIRVRNHEDYFPNILANWDFLHLIKDIEKRYEMAYAKGWVRLVDLGKTIFYTGKPSNRQLRELKNAAIEKGKELRTGQKRFTPGEDFLLGAMTSSGEIRVKQFPEDKLLTTDHKDVFGTALTERFRYDDGEIIWTRDPTDVHKEEIISFLERRGYLVKKPFPREAMKRNASAYIRDVGFDHLPMDVQLEILRFIPDCHGKTFCHYGMVVSELEGKADQFNLALANTHLKKDARDASTYKQEVEERKDTKFVLLMNDKVIDGHHFMAKAKLGGFSASLNVLDLTPARMQRNAQIEKGYRLQK